MIDIIKEKLTPVRTEYTKVRCGTENDGAYIFYDELSKICNCVISVGIGDNVKFDEFFSKTYDKQIYMFDDNLEEMFLEDKNFFYKKQLVTYNFLKEFIESNKLEEKDIILKMDIEGGEYPFFKDSEEKIIKLFSQMSIEFHDVIRNPVPFIETIELLKQYFYIFHIHGNNYGGIYAGLPDVLEISFVRKDLIKEIFKEYESYPIEEIDFPNDPFKQDYILNWWVK